MELKKYIETSGTFKLVIGNGFDLHCGLHTSYSDYYCKKWKKYRRIQRLLHNYVNKEEKIDFSDKEIDSWNIWDVFFALNSSDDPRTCKRLWCDIERLILASLISSKEMNSGEALFQIGKDSTIHWPDLEYYVTINEKPTDAFERFVTEFVQDKMAKEKYAINRYYDFILLQLNQFEKAFGEFIYFQIHDRYLERINHGQQFHNDIYVRKVTDTLDELTGRRGVIDIDSFNYSPMYIDKDYKTTFRYINGSFENPIFGVDSIFKPDDRRFVFTKTSRRMESKLINENCAIDSPIKNVIVYGHSLNSADYSYFFPVFDKLQLLDSEGKGKLVFAYTIYNKNDEQTIKSTLRQSVSEILFNYAVDKGVSNPSRFLDSISTQNRIFFYEIESIPKDRYIYRVDHFEDEWNKMIQEMEQEIDKEE